MMTTRKILLCMPSHSGIIYAFSDGLKHHGFDVTPFPFEDRDFKYPNLFSRLGTKFRQTILKQKDAKEQLRLKLLAEKLKQLLAEKSFDHILFIRGDIFPSATLTTIKQTLATPLINYQWDGLDRYPDIWQSLSYFDKFYVFDPADLSHNGHRFLPATNFYFDHPINTDNQPKADFYFTGTHQDEREHSLKLFVDTARQLGCTLDFHLAGQSEQLERYRKYPEIQTSKTGFDYSENLAKAHAARIIVDFKTPAHNGLSFRPFEALGYRKKLITTNNEITKYDFYHPNNIFVWNGQNLDGLGDFLNTPYHELPSEIYEKYSFGNWIRYILDIHPHLPINLPE